MRLSEFSGKEIIGLDNGERLGVIGDSDLEINPTTGEIVSIILPGSNFFSFGKKREDTVVPWNSIMKIGPEIIIVRFRSENAQASHK